MYPLVSLPYVNWMVHIFWFKKRFVQILLDHQILSDCLGSAEYNEGGSKGWLTRWHMFTYHEGAWYHAHAHDVFSFHRWAPNVGQADNLYISLHHGDPILKTRFLKSFDPNVHDVDLYPKFWSLKRDERNAQEICVLGLGIAHLGNGIDHLGPEDWFRYDSYDTFWFRYI